LALYRQQVHNELDLSYPAQDADVHASSSYLFRDFFERVCTAYEQDPPVLERVKVEGGYQRDQQGLIWTHKEQL
jgi:hypothetical protein